MTKDVEINDECTIRRDANGSYGKHLNLRVGAAGWHKEATNLTVEEARALRAELDAFIRANEAATASIEHTSAEGWAWPDDAKKEHYFLADGRSICGKWLIQQPERYCLRPLRPAKVGRICAVCNRLLLKRERGF